MIPSHDSLSSYDAPPGAQSRETLQRMDDAFTLLRRAVDRLPEGATAENGRTVGEVRADLGRQSWERALDGLIGIGDVHPGPQHFWELLAEAARQMMLDRSSRWCRWRGVDAGAPSLGTAGSGRSGTSATALPTEPEP